jgi:hypothetical protein
MELAGALGEASASRFDSENSTEFSCRCPVRPPADARPAPLPPLRMAGSGALNEAKDGDDAGAFSGSGDDDGEAKRSADILLLEGFGDANTSESPAGAANRALGGAGG